MRSILLVLLFSSCGVAQAQDFFDDFVGTTVDTTKWKIANQVWGNVAGKITNGGVVPQNVKVADGNLVIEGHGKNYQGTVKGFGQNTRKGGAIFTSQPFASGRFEVRAKICPHPGALSAFWTFYYENDDYNHEIDFEMPGNNQPPNGAANSDLQYGLMTSWRGVGKDQYLTFDKFFGNQADGQYHLYRFEWHTGGNGKAPLVEWYYDDVRIASTTNTNHIPNHAANFWVGVWFPSWIQESDFDKVFMYIDWVRITPFHDCNDIFTNVKNGCD